MDYTRHFRTKNPTSLPTEPTPGTVENNAGGYVYQIDMWKRLDRFLILGTSGNTYYCTEREQTRENAQNVLDCLKEDGLKTLTIITEMYEGNRAPKVDPILFSIALCASSENPAVRKVTLEKIPTLIRTAAHLLLLVNYLHSCRGWGRGAKRAIVLWYKNKQRDALVYQLLKYQRRHGWSHKDVFRMVHPKYVHTDIFAWVCGKSSQVVADAPQIFAYESLNAHRGSPSSMLKESVKLIQDTRLPREAVPTEFLNCPEIWQALLADMPLTALIKNLGKISSLGMVEAFSDNEKFIVNAFNTEALRKARVHPILMLTALMTYRKGKGVKGKLSWSPNQAVVKALEKGFYESFANVEPTGKRIFIGLDISGSMSCGTIAGSILSPRDAASAMGLVTATKEPQCIIHCFSDKFYRLNVGAGSTINEFIQFTARLPHGGTDCALPMIFALHQKIPVDCFIIYTDNETWAGNMKPAEALRIYCNQMGINAKLIVVGMTATQFSIADPKDPNMLDIVGFDASAPQIMAEFINA